jgi:hypothetical protein
MDPLLKKPPATDLSPSTEPESRYLDYYRIIRGQVEHEDNLIGSRISWYVTSQSFLFSAYAIIASGIQPNTVTTGGDPKHTLLTIIPSIAIATSAMILVAIISGLKAMSDLRGWYNRFAGKLTSTPLPPVHGERSNRIMGAATPVLLPLLFLGVWVFLLVKRLF